MSDDPSRILAILDKAAQDFKFPMLDNGYVYLAATRMSLFRSLSDWAVVVETFGYSPRAGLPDTQIGTFASRLHNRKTVENYINEEAFGNYLKNNPHNEAHFIYPLTEGSWLDIDDCDHVAKTGKAQLRDMIIPLPSVAEYHQEGINMTESRAAVFEFCRYLAAKWRDKVLATQMERCINILPEMCQILQLEEWHHPDLVNGELPSETETFQQLARVLACGDVSLYSPAEEPNTHWINWPDGGTL
jgi:uncharacterized protein DUF7003